MSKYLLMFELLHSKYEYLEISAAFRQTFVLFTPVISFYDHFFFLKSWYSDMLYQKKQNKNMLKDWIIFESLNCI